MPLSSGLGKRRRPVCSSHLNLVKPFETDLNGNIRPSIVCFPPENDFLSLPLSLSFLYNVVTRAAIESCALWNRRGAELRGRMKLVRFIDRKSVV